jgi:HAE1 family hydrophobic/amphiphilic exporter-1
MRRSGLMTDIDTDYQENVSEVRVVPDRQKASQHGVDVNTIGTAIEAMIGGMPVGKFTQNGRRYDVRIRLAAPERSQAEQIACLQVWNNRNELVELKDVVSIQALPASLTITRRDRERAISIFANIAPGKSQTAALDEISAAAKRVLPPGYRAVFTGSAQAFQESFFSLIVVFFLGILVSYMVLASQFNSYLQPVFILFALPFSISGAFLAMWMGGQSLNIYSLIGIILLMGIVKKNSILLVDFTNRMRREGMDVRAALLHACPVRLRPILMTSLATLVAALPPAFAIGPGAETRIPMAIAVVGGVFFSTLLTLFVVPAMYYLLDRGRVKKGQVT